MFIRTCKKKQSLMITCMSNHTTNAKYTKYMHLGTILPGHKCEVLKTYWHRTQSTIKHRENRHKVKQGFLIKEFLLPFDICISPMNFSPYECAQGRISPLKNVHISHKIFSPFLSRIDKWINRKEGKKRRYEQGYRCMRGARWMRKWS